MKKLSLFFIVIILSGCTLFGSKTASTVSSDGESWELQTRVYASDQCIITGSKKTEASAGAALLGILIQGVAESALSSFGSWVSKQGEAEKKQYSARSETSLYEWDQQQRRLVVNPNLKCLLVVSGKFDPADRPKLGDYTFSAKIGDAYDPETNDQNSINSDVRLARLSDNGIGVKDIGLLYEASIESSADKTAFRIVSRYLEVQKLQSGLKDAGLVVGLSIDGPSADGSPSTLVGSLMSFGKIKPGTLLIKKGLSSKAYGVDGTKYFSKGKGDRSGLLVFPPVNPNSAAVFQSQVEIKNKRLARRDVVRLMIAYIDSQMRSNAVIAGDKTVYARIGNQLRNELVELNDSLALLTQTNQFMPVEISATVTETGDENKALKFIGKVLESKSKDLATTVTAAISPDARAKAKEEEATKQQDLESAMDQSEVALFAAKYEQKTYLDSGEGNELKTRLLELKVEVALKACKKAQVNLGAAGRCE